MEPPSWSTQAQQKLTERGLRLASFEAPGGALRFLHPEGWRVDWRDDHAVVRHGVPPKGHLTLYPIPGDAPAGDDLLAAFLDEFAAPAAQGLNLTNLGALPGDHGLSGAQFTLGLGGREHRGIALAWRDRGLSLIAAYWVEAALFNKDLVTALLQAVLGSVDVGPRSPFHPPLPQGIVPIGEDDLWKEDLPEAVAPVGNPDGCFALRLPLGWSCQPLKEDAGDEGDGAGSRAWLVFPPGHSPANPPEDVVISVTSEDLYGSLEDTMHEATLNLDPQRMLRLELPVLSVERGEQRALVRLFVTHPDRSSHLSAPPQRLWSTAWTDEATVVHLLSIGTAHRLGELMSDLTTLAVGLRVLPRPVDLDGMTALAGTWRFRTFPDPSEKTLVADHRFDLNADGRFELTIEEQLVVEPHAQSTAHVAPIAHEAAHQSEGDGEGDEHQADGTIVARGEWDLVGNRLTFRYDVGGVDVRTLDSTHGQMAIVSGTIWQRISEPAQGA